MRPPSQSCPAGCPLPSTGNESRLSFMVGGVEANPDRASDFTGWAEGYFAAKSRHDLEALVGHFHDDIAYEDAVLGRRTTGRGRMRDTYAAVFAASTGSAGSTLAWS